MQRLCMIMCLTFGTVIFTSILVSCQPTVTPSSPQFRAFDIALDGFPITNTISDYSAIKARFDLYSASMGSNYVLNYEDGNCVGFACYAKWYFNNVTRQGGAPLRNSYSDLIALQIVLGTQQAYENNLLSLIENRSFPEEDDFYIGLTNEFAKDPGPQVIVLRLDSGPSHAVLALRVEARDVVIYDPNREGVQRISYVVSSGSYSYAVDGKKCTGLDIFPTSSLETACSTIFQKYGRGISGRIFFSDNFSFANPLRYWRPNVINNSLANWNWQNAQIAQTNYLLQSPNDADNYTDRCFDLYSLSFKDHQRLILDSQIVIFNNSTYAGYPVVMFPANLKNRVDGSTLCASVTLVQSSPYNTKKYSALSIWKNGAVVSDYSNDWSGNEKYTQIFPSLDFLHCGYGASYDLRLIFDKASSSVSGYYKLQSEQNYHPVSQEYSDEFIKKIFDNANTYDLWIGLGMYKTSGAISNVSLYYE